MDRDDEMAEDLGFNDAQEFTGRSIVLYKSEAGEEAAADTQMKSLLFKKAGIKDVASTLDLPASAADVALPATEALTLPRLGIAVVETPFDAAAMLALEADDPDSNVEAVIPEKYDYLLAGAGRVIGTQTAREPSGQGFEEGHSISPRAIRRLAKTLRLFSAVCEAMNELEATPASLATEPEAFADTTTATWGLIATRVTTSRFSGRGVRVAIIDSGLDLNHLDFRGRRITRRLFAPPGTSPQPTNTHGTHCAGTACGSRSPTAGPRYGIAHEAEIFAIKVFDDEPRPRARRGDVLAGMDFANRAGCRILSLSLGSASNGAVDPEYDRAITRLRLAGSITIAAAGNEGRMGFRVGSPASSPDAFAVAAVDVNLQRADFSNLGPLDISGPGVGVLSSVMGGLTRRLNGTSMATPHVAGIAALWLQSNPDWSVSQLETAMRRTARQLTEPASHVGVGLVQAPQ